jgi:hypothetical protein
MVMLILSFGNILLCCLKRQEVLDESVYASRCVSYLKCMIKVASV